MATKTQQLRDSLIRSLQNEPLLVEAEKSLHSMAESNLAGEFRQAVAMSLKTAPPLAEIHRERFGQVDRALIDRFRGAMQAAVSSGANLSDAEKELLSSLDLEKLGEFRSNLDTHLESEPEISKDDLAIYVPAGLGITETFRRSLEQQLADADDRLDLAQPRISADPQDANARVSPYAPGAFLTGLAQPVAEWASLGYAPGAYVSQGSRNEFKPSHVVDREELMAISEPGEGAHEPSPERAAMYVEAEEIAPEDDPKAVRADAALIAASLRADLAAEDAPEPQKANFEPAADGPGVHGLPAVPTLTAALEAIGGAGDDFGFLVRYGRYAPQGRRSEFLIGGLGLSDLSQRLTSWLESHGSLDDQVQVIDEGSGELTIYLVGNEAQY